MKILKFYHSLIETVGKIREENNTIVTINGSFDIIHSGHIYILEEAKKQGDVLIVLLNSDKSVKKYKGPVRPINSERDRARVLSALEMVDYVVLFNTLTPNDLLEKIKPDVHCNGSEWGKNCVEREVVERYGGRIHILKEKRAKSTTDLIEKIIRSYSQTIVRAVFLDRDGTLNVNQPEYLHRPQDFKFAPFAISALKTLEKTDYKIIILTNQSGIGRGYFKEEEMKKVHQWLLNQLKKEKIRIDKIYYCPHRPENNCPCRKPNVGMLLRAVKDFNISLSRSWLIGDGESDIIMGRKANLKTIKIGKKMTKKLKLEPNYYAKNLLEAVKIIQKYNEK